MQHFVALVGTDFQRFVRAFDVVWVVFFKHLVLFVRCHTGEKIVFTLFSCGFDLFD